MGGDSSKFEGALHPSQCIHNHDNPNVKVRAKLVMQEDGNLVLYHGDKPVWCQQGQRGCHLELIIDESGYNFKGHWELRSPWNKVLFKSRDYHLSNGTCYLHAGIHLDEHGDVYYYAASEGRGVNEKVGKIN